MGYSFYLLSKDKKISIDDYNKAITRLSKWNKGEPGLGLRCDVDYNINFIRVGGSFSISGKDAEGFVLNLLINLQELGYKMTVLSSDWEYGSKEDWEWFEKHTQQ